MAFLYNSLICKVDTDLGGVWGLFWKPKKESIILLAEIFFNDLRTLHGITMFTHHFCRRYFTMKVVTQLPQWWTPVASK